MLSSERSIPRPIPGCPPARRGCAPGKVASGGLSFFSRLKPHAKPRPAGVWAGKSAEGCIHSVMDTLDYGLSSPQLALMNNGQVFVAGQVQAPMTPPTTQQKSQSSSKMGMLMAADAAPAATSLTVGSSLFAVGCAQNLQIEYIKQNQGVPIYINAYQAAVNNGPLPANTNSQPSYPQWPWKSSVPSVANRGAQLDICFNTGQTVSTVTTKLEASLQINPPAPYATPAAITVNVSPTGIATQCIASFTLTRDMTIPGSTLRFTVDPNRGVWPSSIPVINTAFNIDPGWKAVPPMKFRIIPIHYKDPTSNPAIDLQAPLVDQNKITMIEKTLLEMYPISSCQYMGVLPESEYVYTVGGMSPYPTLGTRTSFTVQDQAKTSTTPAVMGGWSMVLREMEEYREQSIGSNEIWLSSLIDPSVPQLPGSEINGLGQMGFVYSPTSGTVIWNMASCFLDYENTTDFDYIGDPSKSTIPHEIGHNYNRSHAPTPTIGIFVAPSSTDQFYPYSNGQIGQGNSSSYFDVGMGTLNALPAYRNVTYDLMGYVKPRWISDYTYGGISMQMQSFYNLMHPAASVALAATVVSPSMVAVDAAQRKIEESSASMISLIRFECDNDYGDFLEVGFTSIKSSGGTRRPEPMGRLLFRACSSSGEVYETHFDTQPAGDWLPGRRVGGVELPSPEKWSKYQILLDGKVVYSIDFGMDPGKVEMQVRFSRENEPELANGQSRQRVEGWGKQKPRKAWARVRCESNPTGWEVVNSFTSDNPVVSIPNRILEENSHPVVEIHACYGFHEKIHSFIWNDNSTSNQLP
jgi:hypothetical protein